MPQGLLPATRAATEPAAYRSMTEYTVNWVSSCQDRPIPLIFLCASSGPIDYASLHDAPLNLVRCYVTQQLWLIACPKPGDKLAYLGCACELQGTEN